MGKTFLILGGYGNTGRILSELLLKHTDCKIIIAGRNQILAEKTARVLNEQFFDDRASALRIEASIRNSLTDKFYTADMVIAASSTSRFTKNIAEAAIKTGIDYIDINMSSQRKIDILKNLSPQIVEKKLLFITDCGLDPGMPAALVRYAARYFDKLEIANVCSLIRMNWQEVEYTPSKIMEMAEEFRDYEPLSFRENKWRKAHYNDYKKFDFDDQFKLISGAPVMLEEMRQLPEKYPALRESGFYVAGLNSYINYFVVPVGRFFLKLAPGLTAKTFGKSFIWGLKKFAKPPFKTMLLLSAVGRKNDLTKEVRIKVSHNNGYWLTAASVTALLFQYLRGNFNKSGLYLQGNLVDPAVFLKDLESIGANITINN